jgi:hypothetical protein
VLRHRRAFDAGDVADRHARRHSEADAALDARGGELDQAQLLAAIKDQAADRLIADAVVGDQNFAVVDDLRQIVGGLDHCERDVLVPARERQPVVLLKLLHVDGADHS